MILVEEGLGWWFSGLVLYPARTYPLSILDLRAPSITAVSKQVHGPALSFALTL